MAEEDDIDDGESKTGAVDVDAEVAKTEQPTNSTNSTKSSKKLSNDDKNYGSTTPRDDMFMIGTRKGMEHPCYDPDRWKWRARGVPLRVLIWQSNETNGMPPGVLKDRAELTRKQMKEQGIGSKRVDRKRLPPKPRGPGTEEVDKTCCGDCCTAIYNSFSKVRDWNPFFRREIDLISRKFGSGIASFFRVWRWLLTINFLIFCWWASWTIVPWFITDLQPHFADSWPANVDFFNRDDLGWYTVFGLGRAAMQSPMYYTGFVPAPDGSEYKIGAIWVMSVMFTVLFTFGCIMTKLISTIRSTSNDPEVHAQLKRHTGPDSRLAELVLCNFDMSTGANPHAAVAEAKQLSTLLNTTLDDNFQNIGTPLFHPDPGLNGFNAAWDHPTGWTDQDLDDDDDDISDGEKAVKMEAIHMQRVFEKKMDWEKSRLERQGLTFTPEAKNVRAAQTLVMLVAEDGYEKWQTYKNADAEIARVQAAIAEKEGEINNVESKTEAECEQELKSMAEDGHNVMLEEEEEDYEEEYCCCSKGPGMFENPAQGRRLGILKRQLSKLKAELASINEIAANKPGTDVFHHSRARAGVLLRKKLFRAPILRDEKERIVCIAPYWADKRADPPIPSWFPITDEEALEVLEDRHSDGDVKRSKGSSHDSGPNIEALQEAILDMAAHHEIDGQAGYSCVNSTYSTIGQTSSSHQAGKRVEKSKWADSAGPSPYANKVIARKAATVPVVKRFALGIPHTHTGSGIAQEESCLCGVSKQECFRWFNRFLTFLLVVGTAAVFAACSAYDVEIVEYSKMIPGFEETGLESAPALLQTIAKTIVPLVVQYLVKCDNYTNEEEEMTAILIRVYLVKIIALVYFAYNLQETTISPLRTVEYNYDSNTTGTPYVAGDFEYYQYQCVAFQMGSVYLNLIWVNTAVQIVSNAATYIGMYWVSGKKTEYDATTVALAYIELFYTQGLLWLGTPWAPIIPIVWVMLASCDCSFYVFILNRFCKPSEKTTAGQNSQDVVDKFMALTFFITIVPAMFFLNGDPDKGLVCADEYDGALTNWDNAFGNCTTFLPCGPISTDHSYRYQAMTDWINTMLSQINLPGFSFSAAMMYLTEPMVAYLVMMIILGCCMLQYCMLRQVRAEAAHAYNDLYEAVEERAALMRNGRDEMEFRNRRQELMESRDMV